jgi:hypothetical protein
MGVVGHGDVQGVLDIDLSTEIEEPRDGASWHHLYSLPLFPTHDCGRHTLGECPLLSLLPMRRQ